MASEQTKIWILIQEEKTNSVSVNHGRWGYSMRLKEMKGAFCRVPSLSDPTSFFILKCDELWKNQVIPKMSHLFITITFSKLLNLTFCVSKVEQVCMVDSQEIIWCSFAFTIVWTNCYWRKLKSRFSFIYIYVYGYVVCVNQLQFTVICKFFKNSSRWIYFNFFFIVMHPVLSCILSFHLYFFFCHFL